jgi:hypothetical protein
MAMAFFPGRTRAVMSNRKRRNILATSRSSATWIPFSQTSAR